MTKNIDGHDVEVDEVSDYAHGGVTVKDRGYTFGITDEELATLGRDPKPGDSVIVCTRNLSNVVGIVIAGRVLRYKTADDVERERREWLDNYARQKRERYEANIEKWLETVSSLHPTLQKRVRRFEAEKGVREFWTEDGGYELVVLTGANALINWAGTMSDNPGEQVDIVKSWWNLNTAEHNYNYQAQMDLVPDFGEGHSGNTAGAAYSMAKAILAGSYTE